MEYLQRERRGLIDSGPVTEEFGRPARYEAFIRDGLKEGYRAEWHPGDAAPFLGGEGFVKKVVRDIKPQSSLRRKPMGLLLKKVAAQAGVSAGVLRRKGRSAAVVDVRDRFIWQAVMEEGHRGAEVAAFLGCDPSNVSRALQKVRQIGQV